MTRGKTVLVWLLLSSALCTAGVAATELDEPYIFGVKIRAGGRFDNVRRCVASAKGTPGGPAADISAFAELPVGTGKTLHVDVPLMRPILFATAFKMLQLEPSVTLKFKDTTGASVGWVAGPTLGVSLHYGPDYQSELDGPKFFALGPIVGGYFGLDFRRPGQTYNFELGLTPYAIPLFGISDPESHKGVVVGGLLDASFRFAVN